MYKKIIRPVLFLLSPETIHHLIVGGMKVLRWIPGATCLIAFFFRVRHPLLETEVFGLKFPNPVGLAAGFDKNAEVYNELSAFGFGFIEIGTVTPKPQSGNPRPRIFRLVKDGAIINRMGFNNKGADNASLNLSRRHCRKPIIGGNLGKNTTTPNDMAPADYLHCFRRLYEKVDYFVINVSCPNIADLCGLQDKEHLKDILKGLVDFRKGHHIYRPILLKISPDLTYSQVDDTISVLSECGIDGIVAVNTTTKRENLATDPTQIALIGNGGLSGSPLTERSIEMVRYIHQKTEGCFPIIGVGGIMTEDDALAMLEAGASLVQVYTGFIYNGPGFVRSICKKIIRKKCKQK